MGPQSGHISERKCRRAIEENPVEGGPAFPEQGLKLFGLKQFVWVVGGATGWQQIEAQRLDASNGRGRLGEALENIGQPTSRIQSQTLDLGRAVQVGFQQENADLAFLSEGCCEVQGD